jgi:hypothetical protein
VATGHLTLLNGEELLRVDPARPLHRGTRVEGGLSGREQLLVLFAIAPLTAQALTSQLSHPPPAPKDKARKSERTNKGADASPPPVPPPKYPAPRPVDPAERDPAGSMVVSSTVDRAGMAVIRIEYQYKHPRAM